MDFNIVAVTACVSGVAHTYMAAERLEKVGHHEKWHLKVETQGALGVENRITAEDIARADQKAHVTRVRDRSGKHRCIMAVAMKMERCMHVRTLRDQF